MFLVSSSSRRCATSALLAVVCATTLGSCFTDAPVVGYALENSVWSAAWEHQIESVCVAGSDRELAWMIRIVGTTTVNLRFTQNTPVELLPIADTAVSIRSVSFNLHANCDRDKHGNPTIVERPVSA